MYFLPFFDYTKIRKYFRGQSKPPEIFSEVGVEYRRAPIVDAYVWNASM